jgi:hypothetical protein
MSGYKKVLVLCLVVGFVIGLSPALAQQEDAGRQRLLDLLALVPFGATTPEDAPVFGYVDYRAVEESRGVSNPGSREVFQADEGSGLWINAMMRVITGPDPSYMRPQIEEMPEVVGFDFFDTDRGLAFGTPPLTGTVFAGRYDTDRMGTVLDSRGFAQEDYSGITIWWRYDDLAMDIAGRNPADPFGGYLGRAARIAVIPGEDETVFLANSALSELTHAMVDSALEPSGSLAEQAEYRTLAEAVTDPARYEGPLVQALAFNVMVVGLVPADPMAQVQGGTDAEPTAGYGELPFYSLALLADRQDGDEEVHLIALLYDSAVAAEAGASELAARLRSLALPERPDDVIVERFGSTVTPHVYKSEQTGLAAAVVEVRQTGPALGERTEGLLMTQGRMFRLWMNMITRRQFTPLWLLTE